MSFLETPRFPDNIAFGAVIGPTYMTVVTPVYSGRDGRIAAWQQAKVQFEVGRRAMSATDTAALDTFFRVVKGRAHGFRIKDWTDFTDGASGTLTTTSTFNVFQLSKLYAAGSLSEQRLIQKPVSGTIGVYRNGGLLSSGVSIDYTTGLVTLSAFASSNITNVTVGSSTQITLTAPISGLTTGGLLYLSGLSGADASFLNNHQYTVTGVSSSTYTLSVNTTGKTITAGSGVGSIYVQPTDVMAWTGQFDVPVRFDVDEMKKQVSDRNGASGDLLVDWGSIPIIEIRL